MTNIKKRNLSQVFVSIFNKSMREIEALKEFYKRTQKTLNEYESNIKNEYKFGLILNKYFFEIFSEETTAKKNIKIKEIKERILIDNKKIKEVCEIYPLSSKSNSLRYAIKADYYEKLDPQKAQHKFSSMKEYNYILISSILSNIIIIFEKMLEKIYKCLLLANPKKYFENQTLLISELFFEDIKDTINKKIESEIESKMYDSLKTLTIIMTKENIVIDRYEQILEDFKEIYYRRNCYIHSSGRVNKKYIENVSSKYKKNLKQDILLHCDNQYINNALNTLTKIIFSIIFELIKIQDTFDERSVTKLANYFFECLKENEYEIAKTAYLALYKCKELDSKDQKMYEINYINALKQLGNKKEATNLIEQLDVSIATDNFRIAKECLANNNKKVYDMLQQTYPDSFRALEIREWPIFLNFRESKYYQKFVNEHLTDFEIQEIEQNKKENNVDTEKEIDNMIKH